MKVYRLAIPAHIYLTVAAGNDGAAKEGAASLVDDHMAAGFKLDFDLRGAAAMIDQARDPDSVVWPVADDETGKVDRKKITIEDMEHE
jgi:hypothetical protein